MISDNFDIFVLPTADQAKHCSARSADGAEHWTTKLPKMSKEVVFLRAQEKSESLKYQF